MDVVNKTRVPLACNPTASFTMKRGEHKELENVKLLSHFASWLGKVSGRPVSEDTFETDLLDGVALCTVMAKIEGSGVTRFHNVPTGSIEALDAFKSRENIQSFVVASKLLNLPVTFGTEDLEKGNIGRICSTLVFLAHTAHAQGVTVEEMDSEIIEKVEEMDAAIAQVTDEETKSDESSNTAISSQELTWWQNLLVKLGFGDWINSLNVETLKAYIATVKANVQAKIGEQKLKIDDQTQLIKQKFEEQKQKLDQKIEAQKTLIKQSSETFHGKVMEKTSSWKDALPEALKSRLG